MKQDWNEPDGGLPPEEELNGAVGEEEMYADEGVYEDSQEQYAYEPEETGGEYAPDVSSPYIAAENPGFTSEWLGEDQYDEEEERLPKRTIFKPRTRKPSFILAVAVNSFRTLILLTLIFMLAGLGAVIGVAKAYMETAPTLDLTAIDEQAQTSFIYDADGNLITDYKGTENRIMVSIDTIPMQLRNAFVGWRTRGSTPTTALTSSASSARSSAILSPAVSRAAPPSPSS